MILTPGKLGEIWKDWLVQETREVPLDRTIPVVGVERLTDVLGVLALSLAGVLAFGGSVWQMAGLLGLIVALVFLLHRESLVLGSLNTPRTRTQARRARREGPRLLRVLPPAAPARPAARGPRLERRRLVDGVPGRLDRARGPGRRREPGLRGVRLRAGQHRRRTQHAARRARPHRGQPARPARPARRARGHRRRGDADHPRRHAVVRGRERARRPRHPPSTNPHSNARHRESIRRTRQPPTSSGPQVHA